MLTLALATAIALPAGAAARAPSLRSFEQALAAQPSATEALTQWCAAQRIADPAAITAEPVNDEYPGSQSAVRTLLGVGAEEPVAYRNVRLTCGGKVLSVAYNWYVPARLTPAMNEALTTTSTPFGTVAAPLNFTRQTLARVRGAMNGCPKDTVLSQLALLKVPEGQAISAVIECYTPANLADPGK
jgi:hypothetical protein